MLLIPKYYIKNAKLNQNHFPRHIRYFSILKKFEEAIKLEKYGSSIESIDQQEKFRYRGKSDHQVHGSYNMPEIEIPGEKYKERIKYLGIDSDKKANQEIRYELFYAINFTFCNNL